MSNAEHKTWCMAAPPNNGQHACTCLGSDTARVQDLEKENAELRERLADVDRALGSNSGNRLDVIEQLSAAEGQQRACAEKAERIARSWERDFRAAKVQFDQAVVEAAELRARLAEVVTVLREREREVEALQDRLPEFQPPRKYA